MTGRDPSVVPAKLALGRSALELLDTPPGSEPLDLRCVAQAGLPASIQDLKVAT